MRGGRSFMNLWERLKLQIDNLEEMYKKHKEGNDVSTMVYWQVETINEMLKGLEINTGADEVREKYRDFDKL